MHYMARGRILCLDIIFKAKVCSFYEDKILSSITALYDASYKYSVC